ncbi:NADH-quinone oxidoreductase subunit N [Candidatus Poribacteria bacterium]|nr:NADH-quinone oxidoreductase subunit N [Candidatus Poribacteria bacterium]
MQNLLLFLPETICLLVALMVFLCTILRVPYRTTWLVSLIGGVGMVLGAVMTLGLKGEPFFPDIYRVDFFSQLIKSVLATGFLLAVIAGRGPQTLRPSTWHEFPMFMLFSTAGMMALVSSTELITLYVSMELSAFPIYVLVALHRDQRTSSEGAVKYAIQGMAASALTIYGMSFLYGLSGTTSLAGIAAQLPTLASQPVFWMAMLFSLAGFFFKLALFPFHFWAPDTYQSAPHPVVTFLATASKVAAVALLCRFFSLTMGGRAVNVTGLGHVLVWISVIAMTLGNLAAIAQNDLKRLLGYSTVAHAGYALVSLQAFSELGLNAALFYIIGYFAMAYVCFLVVSELARDEDFPNMDSLAGLYKRSPFLALALLTGLFGLSGLPPTVGFIGKWFLFSAALERGQLYLVLFAALNSAVAVYYYLKMVRYAYLVPPVKDEPIEVSPIVRLTGLAAILFILWMGTFPGAFWTMARRAADSLISL